jgi:PAS domain-containing protein
MLAEEVDFYQVFKLHPTAMALLTADLEFIDANDEFLASTGRKLEELIGHNVFAVLPKMPPEPGGDPKWTALEAAQASGRRESMSLERYDIEDPASPGVFRERYWSAAVTPVRGGDGHVEVLELSTREVTPIITEYKKLLEQEDRRLAASPGAAAGTRKPVP